MYLYHIFVFLVSTSIYYNSLTGDFVHDDIVAIVRNPDVNLARSAKIGLSLFSSKGENGDRWWSLWKNDYWGMPMSSPFSHKSYRPLTVLTFRLNYYLCDNSLCPEIFHGTNILIHGLVSCLTLHLCKSVLQMRLGAALLTSLIFALHPIHTEAVAGITGRADALACLLMLISFLLYHKVISHFSSKIIDCQCKPEKRESEKCSCKLNSAQKNFVSVSTGNQSNAIAAKFVPNYLDLNENEYLISKMPTLKSSTFVSSKSHVILMISGFVGCAAMLAKETGVTILGINLLFDLYLHVHLFMVSPTQKKLNNSGNQADKNYSYQSYFQHESQEQHNPAFKHNRDNFGKRIIFLISLIFLSLSLRFALMDGEFPKFGRQDNPTAYSHSDLTRLLTYAYLPVFNFLLAIYNQTLSYDWQMGSIPLIETIWDSRNFATFSFYITLFFLVRKGINAKKYKPSNTNLVVALLFIVIPYLPASNLLFPVGFVVAERVLYIPSLGICMLVVHGLESIHQAIKPKSGRKYLLQIFYKFSIWICVCSLLLSFGLRTWQRNAVWQSRLTLFTSGIQDVPHNAKMHYNYANLKKDLGQSDKAIEHYATAIKLWPEYASAHNNLGTLLMGNPALAEHHFLRAIEAGNQAHGGAHFNVGVLYMQNKKYLEAASHLKKSIIIDPSHREAMEYLSICYSMIHNQKEKKSKQEISSLLNSTSGRQSVTTAKKIDFNSNNGSDVVFQTTELHLQYKMSRTSRNSKSSNQIIQNSSSVIYRKPLQGLNVWQGMREFVC